MEIILTLTLALDQMITDMTIDTKTLTTIEMDTMMILVIFMVILIDMVIFTIISILFMIIDIRIMIDYIIEVNLNQIEGIIELTDIMTIMIGIENINLEK